VAGSASAKAKRSAAVILEVLSGMRSVAEASEAMGVSANRYYQLEARGLEGLVEALEPRSRGRRRSKDDEIAKLVTERERLTREVNRLLTLVRSAQRTMGIPAVKKPRKGAPKRRRASHRGKKVVARLRKPVEDEEGGS
jgi:hypothetical protein